MTAGISSEALAPNLRETKVPPIRVVLLGLGAINSRVVDLLRSRQSNVAIVGIIARRAESLDRGPLSEAVRILTASDLESLAPDVVLEAASRGAVREWGDAALRAARRVVISSASAFADDDLLRALRATARECGSQLVLSPGAIAGTEALSAAARLGIAEVRHRIIKPPPSWAGAAPRELLNSPGSSPVVLFAGSARAAAHSYPQNANVTVLTALAGIGLDATVVELVSDPSATSNRHEIRVRGDFGSLDIAMENRALLTNPKSSELAALALVRLIENEAADLVL